jgi:hypothetical protein
MAHRTVRCATGQCAMCQDHTDQTSHSRVFPDALRYNSPDCPVCHRTIRCATGLSGAPVQQRLSSATVDCNGALTALQWRTVRGRVRGAPNSEHDLSGVAPDCPVPHVDKCDRTSQVIRPTYSCPCPTDLRQPCRCT